MECVIYICEIGWLMIRITLTLTRSSCCLNLVIDAFPKVQIHWKEMWLNGNQSWGALWIPCNPRQWETIASGIQWWCNANDSAPGDLSPCFHCYFTTCCFMVVGRKLPIIHFTNQHGTHNKQELNSGIPARSIMAKCHLMLPIVLQYSLAFSLNSKDLGVTLRFKFSSVLSKSILTFTHTSISLYIKNNLRRWQPTVNIV